MRTLTIRDDDLSKPVPGESQGKSHVDPIALVFLLDIKRSRSFSPLLTYIRTSAGLAMPGYDILDSQLKGASTENVSKYRCPACHLLLRDAVQPSCGHWLCTECAVEIFATK